MRRDARTAEGVEGGCEGIFPAQTGAPVWRNSCSVLAALGGIAYGIALISIGDFAGELFSDIGTGIWLLAILLLLLRLSHRLERSGREQEGGP